MIKRIFTFLFGIGLLVLFAWTLYFLFERSQTKPVVYETESPSVIDIVKKAVAAGSIEPRNEVAIKPRISGVVEKLYVEAGQLVKQGALIAKIRIIPDAVTLNSAEARLDSAKIGLDNAQIEFNRRKKLLQKSLISKAEYNERKMEYDLKAKEVENAQNNVQLIKKGVSGKGDKVSNEIKATVSGMVLEVPVKEGVSVIETNNFNEGTTIALIADMKDLVFIGKVDESEVGKISEGLDLEIKIGAIEDRVFKGKLEFISPKGEENDGAIQFEIRAAIGPEAGVLIRAGYSASGDIVLERRDQALSIKERLLNFEDDEIFVEIEIAAGQFEKRIIKVGISDGINIEVLSGIDETARIKKPF
jgi:HlyD family secretion protein